MAKIPKVTERDDVVGETTIEEARENNWWRRIARVYIVNPSRTKILLQKRSLNMKSYPGAWDQAVGGHVDAGETYYEAAIREMSEEIGIINMPLEEIATSIKHPQTFNGVFKLVLEEHVKFDYDPHEVDFLEWTQISEFEENAKKNPEMYCAGFVDLWHVYRDKLMA